MSLSIRGTSRSILALLIAAITAPSVSRAAAPVPPEVSAQGLLVPATPRVHLSPSRAIAAQVLPRGSLEGSIVSDLEIRTREWGDFRLERVRGHAWFVSDLPAIVVVDGPEVSNVPGTIRIYRLDGRIAHARPLRGIASPSLSPDGMRFACTCVDGLFVMDLRDGSSSILPPCEMFALGPGDAIAALRRESDVGISIHVDVGGTRCRIPLHDPVREIAFSADGSSLFILDKEKLVRADLPTGALHEVFHAALCERLRDLECADERIHVGARRTDSRGFHGVVHVLDADGNRVERIEGPTKAIPAVVLPRDEEGISWPLLPDAQHPVGNTYGEYQTYGAAPYPHPGIDVLASPGQPVFAVRGGFVKAVFTMGGAAYWRIAVGESAGAWTQLGYLYAHIDPSSIAVDVGDTVAEGQYLGDVVTWPVYDFHHCHFTQVQDSGVTWDGFWLSVHNPHLDLSQQSEGDAPVFGPARRTDLLAFCANQTSTYQDPRHLHGPVDIIAHVGDRVGSSWLCTVQELRYTIYPLGMPDSPIIDDMLAQYFDFVSDSYDGGLLDAFMVALLYKDDQVCNSVSDYENREFFHVLTNSDGDGEIEETDPYEAWDTSLLPDMEWVVKVTAIDVRGNVTRDSMVVATANGNPADLAGPECRARSLSLSPPSPNPSGAGGARLTLHLPRDENVRAVVYDATGSRVQTLAEGPCGAGRHTLDWEGRDARGNPAAPGVYFLRVDAGKLGATSTRIVKRH